MEIYKTLNNHCDQYAHNLVGTITNGVHAMAQKSLAFQPLYLLWIQNVTKFGFPNHIITNVLYEVAVIVSIIIMLCQVAMTVSIIVKKSSLTKYHDYALDYSRQ